MHILQITQNSKTSFPRTEKYRFMNHGKNKSSFTLHAKQKCPFSHHEKSIGDPLKEAATQNLVSGTYLNSTLSYFSNWSNFRRKYLSKFLRDINTLSCMPKARHPQKSSQHVRACAARDGAVWSKNRRIVPYYTYIIPRFPSPIMAPG